MSTKARLADEGESLYLNRTVENGQYRHIGAFPTNERDSVLITIGGVSCTFSVVLTPEEAYHLGSHLVALAAVLAPVEVG